MAYRKQIEITPSTITNLTVVVKDDTFFRTLTLNDFTLDGDVLIGHLTVSDGDAPISIYSQGYEPIITTFDDLSNSITLTPTSDYIKTSDGTNDYYVKDKYSRQFGNDLLDIVMTKADSSDIPAAISDLTDDTSTNPIDKAESVADQRDSSSLKYWTGTKAQYDAIATKDNNTIYNVEDSSTLVVDILNSLYPIGAIYIGTMATCPLSVLGIGTWQLVAQDRVLQGAGTRGTVGSEIDESLPNIKGGFVAYKWATSPTFSGAIYQSEIASNMAMNGGTTVGQATQNLDASRSSSTYQDNAPVQQDGYLVNIWERTA